MKPIFSDDPQAIEKLKRKIETLQRSQEEMKRVNAGFKKHGAEWVKNEVTPETFRFYMSGTQYSWNKNKFFPAWALSNNSAVIRQAKKRLEILLQTQGE